MRQDEGLEALYQQVILQRPGLAFCRGMRYILFLNGVFFRIDPYHTSYLHFVETVISMPGILLRECSIRIESLILQRFVDSINSGECILVHFVEMIQVWKRHFVELLLRDTFCREQRSSVACGCSILQRRHFKKMIYIYIERERACCSKFWVIWVESSTAFCRENSGKHVVVILIDFVLFCDILLLFQSI